MRIDGTKLAYIAGLFDGEGSIVVAGNYLSLSVSISNTDLTCLEAVRNALGGRIYRQKMSCKRHKVGYHWRIGGKPAAIILGLVLPYLIIKKERALLGIKLALAKPKDRVNIAVKIRILNKTGNIKYEQPS